MPYGPESATKFTKKANTPKKKRQWSHVFESAISRGADESSAFAQAAGVIKKNRGGKSPKKSRSKQRGKTR